MHAVDRFWTPRRVGLTYLLLFAVSIPWYLPSGYGEGLIAGFPLWCLLSLGCYLAAAALTVATIDSVWSAGSGSPTNAHEADE